MKKILTVSLFAMMAVSAANADIASTDYVGKQITATAGTLTDLKTTAKGNLVAAINEVDANVGTVSFEANTPMSKATNLTDAIVAVNAQINAMSGELLTDLQGSINELAGTVSGMDTAYKAADTALGNRLTTAEGDITALETSLSATGTTGKAIADNKKAIADMDTAYKAADTAIKNTIGTVDEGKTVVEMISEAQTNATYDDTEVRGLITTNKNNISAMDTAYKAADTALGNRLTTAEGKITTIEGQQTTQDGKISALETSLSATGTTGKAIADNKKAIADMDTAYKAADTTTLNSAKAFTTEQIEALGKLATIDTACAQGVTDCALVIRSGEIKWEKVSY